MESLQFTEIKMRNSQFKRVQKLLKNKSVLISRILLIATSIGLLASMVYVGWHSNLYLATDSDGIVNTYLYMDFQLRDMIVPGNHTLLMKWPLFAIQSLFEYNYTNYALFNYGLLFATMIGWLVGLTILFGKKYYPFIAIGLSLILLGSLNFSNSLMYGSLRNIEYPIGLFFLIAVIALLQAKRISKKLIIGVSISAGLFALAVAGDSLMIFSFVVPLFLLAGIYWISGGKITKRMGIVAAIALGAIATGFILQRLGALLGIAIYHFDAAFIPVIVSNSLFWPSLTTAFDQLFIVSGAEIAGKVLSPSNAVYFFKFTLVLLSIIGLISAIIRFYKSKQKNILKNEWLPGALLALSFIITFAVYVILDMVYATQADGTVVNANSYRYLELLPLLLIAGGIYAYQLLPKNRKTLIATFFVLAALGSVLLSAQAIHADMRRSDVESMTRINTQKQIGTILTNENVPFFASGYWDGATTRFWTDKDIQYSSISSCKFSGPDFNTRKSWLTEDQYTKTALVVDRFGRSSSYWQCTDEQIEDIYGKPEKKIDVNDSPTSPIVFIYNYDIREKIQRPY